MYLYFYGGIYADLDFQCLRSFEPFITEMERKNIDVSFGTLGRMDDEKFICHDIPNALMVSRARADFWKFVIKALQNTQTKNLAPEFQTGPVFLKICIDAYTRKNKNVDTGFITATYGANIFENMHDIDYSSNIFITAPAFFYSINWNNKNHHEYRKRLYGSDELRILVPDALAITFWMHSW